MPFDCRRDVCELCRPLGPRLPVPVTYFEKLRGKCIQREPDSPASDCLHVWSEDLLIICRVQRVPFNKKNWRVFCETRQLTMERPSLQQIGIYFFLTSNPFVECRIG